VNIPGTTTEKTVRTVFPEITSRAPDNDLLWLGCMKGARGARCVWLSLPARGCGAGDPRYEGGLYAAPGIMSMTRSNWNERNYRA